MDDLQRRPSGGDRDALVARIKRAADEGRIAAADRDIRLANVASASSMSDLDLIGRDLDQLEAAVVAGTPDAPMAFVGPSPTPFADQVTDQAVGVAKTTVRSIGVVTLLILLLAGAAFAGLTYFGSDAGSEEPRSEELFTPEPIPSDGVTQEPSADPADDPGSGQASGSAAYGLTGAGIRSFLADYEEKFGTILVVDLTLYDDYAVVQVPQAGKKRHAGFLFHKERGWQDFGGLRANFPGAQVVDLGGLDVPALVRNIAEARRTLNVEEVSQTYAIVRHYGTADEVPSVDIHVSNEYGESGYLATTLDGTVERAYPYDS